MHPRMTHIQASAHDASEHSFASAGARAFGNEYAGSAVASALYHAFAERKPRRSLPHLERLLEEVSDHEVKKP
jgi:hypothetical protein